MADVNNEFVEEQKRKALTRWRWHNPYVAALLAFIHPLGMLYTSIAAFVVYLVVWLAVFAYWPNRRFGVGLGLGALFAVYAYCNTRWKNAAIEKWKYGLQGTGKQNPKDLTPIA
jgi:hypothetical protein